MGNLHQRFWCSGILTDNQTSFVSAIMPAVFWCSGILTDNQTQAEGYTLDDLFWCSGILTDNQTEYIEAKKKQSFGAVAF